MKKTLSVLALTLNLTVFAAPAPAETQTTHVVPKESLKLGYEQYFVTWAVNNKLSPSALSEFIGVLHSFQPDETKGNPQQQYAAWSKNLSTANKNLLTSYESAVLNPLMPNHNMSTAEMNTFMTKTVPPVQQRVLNQLTNFNTWAEQYTPAQLKAFNALTASKTTTTLAPDMQDMLDSFNNIVLMPLIKEPTSSPATINYFMTKIAPQLMNERITPSTSGAKVIFPLTRKDDIPTSQTAVPSMTNLTGS